MTKLTFPCVDAHTCGNPIRVFLDGAPVLEVETMMERRNHFLRDFDWIRTGLMFEPRGHDIMSGTFLYPSNDPGCDIGVLFIETSGCLPMCGHGLIGTVTVLIERNIVTPRTPGVLAVETPAGRVDAHYTLEGSHVTAVRFYNVPSFLHSKGLKVECPELGELTVDVSYGGNFYAIVEPQENYKDLSAITAADIRNWSPICRQRLNEKHQFLHPEDDHIRGLSHLLWTGKPTNGVADSRNAVFYGPAAIDRSPCGTGTAARMAHLGLRKGDTFVHESIIGSLFRGRVEEETKVGDYDGIVPSIEGWAQITGDNRIYLDERDPFMKGFTVA